MPKAPASPPFAQQTGFSCLDGSPYRPEDRCNGFLNCPHGEDEMNCFGGSLPQTPHSMPPSSPPMLPNPVSVELTETSFPAAIASNNRIVVNFYAPWCKACHEFMPKYHEAARESQRRHLGVQFAQANMETERGLKERFQVNTFPRLLYWDSKFPTGAPRQYYKSYGLTTEGLLLWLEKQMASTVVPFPPCRFLGQFQCPDFRDGGKCLEEPQVCDAVYHCIDGADEQMCPPKSTTPRPNDRPDAGGYTFLSVHICSISILEESFYRL